MAIIGIDLGTTNSLAVVWENGEAKIIKNRLGSELTPSVVSVDEGKILVGQPAKERLVTHPEQTAAAFKRDMGTKKKYKLGEYIFSPEELSSLVISKLKEDAEAYLGEAVEEVIISVPAYFNNDQRYATKTAAKLAGIPCERIVNEPSAAALSCRMKEGEQDQTVLVVDFGGGTLDVSVVECFENIVEIQTIAGDNHLGGKDFDEVIAKQFCKENHIDWEKMEAKEKAILLRRAEKCKMELTESESAELHYRYQGNAYSFVFTSDLLIEISAELFLKLKTVMSKAIRDSGRMPTDITDVLPVGGTCKMPVVREYLAHLFRKPVEELPSGDRVVALGLGVYCGIKQQQGEIKDVLMTDVCPFSLGTDIYNPQNPAWPIMSVIIERNTVLPVKASHIYTTTSEAPYMDIYQGEGYYAHENIKLGGIGINDIPNEFKGKRLTLELIFAYDINGILDVTMRVKETGQEKNITIVSENNPMTSEDIADSQERIKRLNFVDEEENQAFIALAKRIYEESVGEVRGQAERILFHFLNVLKSNSPIRIKKTREEFLPYLNQLETYVEEDIFEREKWMEEEWEGTHVLESKGE